MASCLDDPRAQQLLSASPSECDGLATQFGTVATAAQTAIDGLHGAHGDLDWTGKAADGFRTQLGKLPGDLHKVHESYSRAATALRSYAGELEPIQRQFQTLAPQLRSAQGSLQTAQGNLQTAKTNLSTAKSAPKANASTPAVSSASTAVSSAQGTVGNLSGEVSGLNSRGLHLLDEFDDHRRRAVSAVNDAAGVAPVHHSSFLGGVAHFFSSAGHFVENVGVHIGESFKNVFDGHDIIQFIEHPSWKTFGKLAEDVGTVAGTLAAVAAPFAAPELLAADGTADATAAATDGAAGAAEGGEGASETVSTFTKVATKTSDYGDKVSNATTKYQEFDDARQGHFKDLAIDGGLDHTPLSGEHDVDRLGLGEDAAKEAKTEVGHTVRYQTLRNAGVDDSVAKRFAYGDEVPRSLAGHTPSADEISATLHHQVGEANRAATRALRVGRPLSTAIDDLTDPLKDRIKDTIAPDPEPAGA